MSSVTKLEIAGPKASTEQALARTTRALKTLSAGVMAVIHAETEGQLLRAMCDVIVEVGGYRLAWLGWAGKAPEHRVWPVAWAGEGTDYLETADIRWDDSALGRGPTGRCIRSGQAQVVSNVEIDPSMGPWHKRAVDVGYRSSVALPVKVNGQVGSLNIYSGDTDAFDTEELELLAQLATELSFGLNALRARVAQRQAAERLERSMETTIHVLAGTVEMRDTVTAGHQRRVSEIAAAIAAELGWSAERQRGVRIAGSAHDIGTIQLPGDLLSKPGPLTAGEFERVKKHPEAGFQLLKDIELPWPVAQVVRQHHERLDGSGYPHGLAGDAIIEESRVVAIADVVAAMCAPRPWRPALGLATALDDLKSGRGLRYDPRAVDAFVRLVDEKRYVLPR